MDVTLLTRSKPILCPFIPRYELLAAKPAARSLVPSARVADRRPARVHSATHPPFDGRQSIPGPCYRSLIAALPIQRRGVVAFQPGDHPVVFTFPLRRWLFTVLVAALSLSATWVVRAATDPAHPSTAPATPSASPIPGPPAGASSEIPIADYATHIPITGSLSAFHESVASRYNYAFGKNTPFYPPMPPPPTASSLIRAASTPPSTAAIATRRPTASGASPRIPTASARPGI